MTDARPYYSSRWGDGHVCPLYTELRQTADEMAVSEAERQDETTDDPPAARGLLLALARGIPMWLIMAAVLAVSVAAGYGLASWWDAA